MSSADGPIINKYLQKLKEIIDNEFDTTQNSFYVFRGHSRNGFEIIPESYRTISFNKNFANATSTDLEIAFEILKQNEINLIKTAKTKGYHRQDNRELRDLEVLADLRHYGCATGLIDFTSNFLVALWFACVEFNYTDRGVNDQKEHNEKRNDGEIFILDIGDEELFREVDHDVIQERNIEDFFKSTSNQQTDDKLWYWIPERLNDRMRDQDGVFVFGAPVIKPELYKNKTIIVEQRDKKDLKKELDLYFDYNLLSLFADKHGFSNYYQKDMDTEDIKIKTHYHSGLKFLKDGNEEKAKTQFTEVTSYAEKNFQEDNYKESDIKRETVSDSYSELYKLTDKEQENLNKQIKDTKLDDETLIKNWRNVSSEKDQLVKRGLEINPNHRYLKSASESDA